MRVVFLCKGSRGDVGPVLALLLDYKQKTPSDVCVLATHHSHKKKFEHVLDKRYGVEFIPLDDPAESKTTSLPSPQKVEMHVSSGRGFGSEERQDRVMEMHSSLRACEGANAVVFNLFACEGWFIAQYLKVPCVAVSPFAVTRTPPVSFESKFLEAYPDLHDRLSKATPGHVSYGDIDHWMWRLYLDDFGEFCESLGLPICPFAEVTPDEPLPPPTPLLYGISPTILNKPDYWPKSVAVCGYWFTEDPYPKMDDVTVLCPTRQSLNIPLPEFLSNMAKQKEHPLYIGFGSMEELGFLSSLDSVELIGIINEGLLDCDTKALLQVHPNSALFKAWEMLYKNVMNCNIYCITQPVSHKLLFPHCLAVMHHGGSGTVASAIRAAVPQIVCPFMFDQSYWADKVAWMGVGESAGHPRSLTVTSFINAMKTVCQDDTYKVVSKYSKMIHDEDGVATAVTILRRVLHR